MTRQRTLLLLLMVILDSALSAHQQQEPIMVAVLLPRDNRHLHSVSRVMPGMDIAMDKVLAPGGLLYGRKIQINYADSSCSSAESMNEAFNFYVAKKSHIFFGPCCDYAAAPVGRQTKFWSIPMMTTALARDFAEAKQDKYTMMTRVGPSINKLADFFAEMLKVFSWSKVNVIYERSGLDHIMENMCHLAAEGLHYTLREKYLFLVPYLKFEALREIYFDLEKHFGTENAESRRQDEENKRLDEPITSNYGSRTSKQC